MGLGLNLLNKNNLAKHSNVTTPKTRTAAATRRWNARVLNYTRRGECLTEIENEIEKNEIVIPLLGTGVRGIAVEDGARVAAESILEWLQHLRLNPISTSKEQNSSKQQHKYSKEQYSKSKEQPEQLLHLRFIILDHATFEIARTQFEKIF